MEEYLFIQQIHVHVQVTDFELNLANELESLPTAMSPNLFTKHCLSCKHVPCRWGPVEEYIPLHPTAIRD